MSQEKDSCNGHDSASEEVKTAGFSSYLRIFKYADSTSRTLYAISFVAAIAAGTALPFLDLIFGKFVTTFNDFATGVLSPPGYMSQVETYTLYFVYLFAAKFALVYIHTVGVSIAAIRTTKALRLDFLQSLLRQDMTFFDSKIGSPSVLVTTNGNLVNNGISEKLSITIQSCSTFVAAFAVAFAVQWKLTLITISVVPAILVVTMISAAIDVKQETVLMGIYAQAGLLAEEVFSSIATVHAFWLQPTMSSRYDALLESAEGKGMKKSANYGVLFSVEFFCVYCGYGLAFWQGIRMYARGEIEEAGSVVTVIFAVIVAATALTQIAPQILQVTKAASAAEELFSTIDRNSAVDSMSIAGHVPKYCVGHIQLQILDFAYPSRPDTRILHSLSLDIPANKTTALVGASGSGKSTIIGLLERWYDQAAGSIYLDGVDIRQLNVRWLRTQVRLVQQEPTLFSGTIFENIVYGLIGTDHANTSHDEKMTLVRNACRQAFADDFIEKLPEGYYTLVGERAGMLSGGQKQRIAIARSIISNPPILLLDEATSALDPKAEKVVQDALDNVSANRTTITIAHKLATIQKADNIAVMSKGSIIEQGTHRELLARGGAYSRLVQAQDLKQAAEGDGSFSDLSLKASEDERTEIHTTRTPSLDLVKTQSAVGSIPQEECRPKEGMGYSLIRCLYILIREQRQLWHLYSIVTVACVLGGGTFPVQAVLFARTFNAFQTRGNEAVEQGDFWALMFFVVAIANFIIYFILGWVTNVIIQRVTRMYRLELFATTMKQELAFFDEEHNATGAITSRLASSATNLQELLGMNASLILINVVNVTASSILGIAYGWKLGLVCVFGALPPLLFSGYLRIRLETKLDNDTSARFASSAALAAEAIAAIRTVASLTMERTIMDRYTEKLTNVGSSSIRASFWTTFWYAITQSINFLAMALGFWYGGRLVSSGEYSTEVFFVIFIAVVFGGEAAAGFFQYTTSLTKAQSAANYILWLRKRTPAIQEGASDEPSNREKDDQPLAVNCDALAFAYPTRPRVKVVKGIDVGIPAGKFVAFVGPSGCGKSTMIALLSRLYDPTSGTIRVNDQPITDIGPRKHRRRLALVQQEPVCYEGSIRDNIAMGIVESAPATEEQIEKACADANILTFVQSLPEGLDTSVGNRGSQLSGGQRQRIAIARALIRDPKILLLDEATSALDTESEKIVQAALMGAAKDGRRSTIAVAHRLSTIKDADYILVFQNGRIAEIGNHLSLIEKGGIYFEMCKGQALDRAA